MRNEMKLFCRPKLLYGMRKWGQLSTVEGLTGTNGHFQQMSSGPEEAYLGQ